MVVDVGTGRIVDVGSAICFFGAVCGVADAHAAAIALQAIAAATNAHARRRGNALPVDSEELAHRGDELLVAHRVARGHDHLGIGADRMAQMRL